MEIHPLTSAHAVRLARFAHAALHLKWLESEAPQYAYANHLDGPTSFTLIGFCLHSRDDLARAEHRVVAAGPPGAHWIDTYAQRLCWILDTLRRPGQLIAFMDADQRARALLKFLDAHPELEPVDA